MRTISTSHREAQAPVGGALLVPASGLRRLAFGLAVTATSLFGAWMMFSILAANGMTWLETAILALFTVTFAWIAIAFWTAVAGFVLQACRLDPLSLRRLPDIPERQLLTARTALVIPVYNEEPTRVMAGLEATLRSLEATGEHGQFDCYLLSDTTNAEIAAQELAAWTALRERMGWQGRMFYRRRERNVGRKAGNLADFCTRWGAYYDFMVVLDADSVMTGDCIVKLAGAMQDNPSVGLIQTVPIPVRQDSFFGRFVQFASVLYSPMLATGLAFWQTDAANYWGHNAILRVSAFTAHCGLPVLKGKPPLGGEILSHDFVEAALLRRAGWDVLLFAELEGSYEEVPATLLDYAKRDRRWVQGNLQHLRLLGGSGLHLMSRVHFLLGAVAYISSALWLLMLALGTLDAVLRALTVNVFFEGGHQLFPNWPIAKPELIFSLLVLTLVMLFAPKALGIVLALRQRRRAFGGAMRLMAGALVEIAFAVLIAPVMMAFHAYFVLQVLSGRNAGWDPQTREGRLIEWREAAYRTLFATVTAIVWGALTYAITPQFFWWLTPILVGLVLAAPIVRWSSSITLGRAMRRLGIFVTPAEVHPDKVLTEVAEALAKHRGPFPSPRQPPALLVERPRQMPRQRFDLAPPAGVISPTPGRGGQTRPARNAA